MINKEKMLCGVFLFLILQTGKIAGVVLDVETGSPLPKVKVWIEETGQSAITDKNGNFEIPKVYPGIYTVSAKIKGVKISVSGVLVLQNLTTTITLGGVKVVTATKELRRIEEVPAICEVINYSQILERGYETVADALQMLPGFHLITDHVNYEIGVRGINGGLRAESRIVKLMLDGRWVAFRPSSGNFLSYELIPIDVIDRIETVRGPISALYGANAYLGAINIIPKDGEKINGFFVRLSRKSPYEKGYLISFFGGKKIGAVDFVIAGSKCKFDRSGLGIPEISPEYLKYSDEISKNDISQPVSMYCKVKSKISSGFLEVDANYSLLDAFGEYKDWGIMTHENRLSLYNAGVGVKLKFPLFRFYYSYSEGAPTKFDHLDIGSDIYWELRDFGYSSHDFTFEIAKSTRKYNLLLGADYSHDDENLLTVYSILKRDYGENEAGDTVLLDPPPLGDTVFRNVGVYLQFMGFTRRLNFIAGGRFDRHNIYGNALSPRLGFVYKISQNDFLKLLYGSSFKAPAPTQLFTKKIKSGGIMGNPDLKPEFAHIVELNYSRKLPKFGYDFTLYFMRIFNYIEFIPKGGGTIAENRSKISAVGLECGSYFERNRIKVRAFGATGIARTDEGEELGLYPRFTFGTILSYSLNGLKLVLEMKYVSKIKASPSNIRENGGEIYYLPQYLLTNLTLTTERLRLLKGRKAYFICKLFEIAGSHIEPGFEGVDIPSLGPRFSLSFIHEI